MLGQVAPWRKDWLKDLSRAKLNRHVMHTEGDKNPKYKNMPSNRCCLLARDGGGQAVAGSVFPEDACHRFEPLKTTSSSKR